MSVTGRCACGAVKYSAADPGFSFLCQCRACQKVSGSGHLAQFVVPRDSFAMVGGTAAWTRETDSGNKVTRHACAICMSPIHAEPSAAPDVLMIAAATLDDPAKFTPQKILYPETAAPWDRPTHAPEIGD